MSSLKGDASVKGVRLEAMFSLQQREVRCFTGHCNDRCWKCLQTLVPDIFDEEQRMVVLCLRCHTLFHKQCATKTAPCPACLRLAKLMQPDVFTKEAATQTEG